MAQKVLRDSDRLKQDSSDDSLFYSQPRFVHHLDEAFRARLTGLYREQISCDSVILDLMSSWVSHLPTDIKYKKVIGHGLNKIELEKNKCLDKYWVQDLNLDQKLPLEDSSIDVCLMVAAWQYLQQPEELAEELKRVIKKQGKLIISFSNRAFWTKAPRVWTNGTYLDHINYISAVLLAQGWPAPESIAEETTLKSVFGFLPLKGDPFFSVIATNST